MKMVSWILPLQLITQAINVENRDKGNLYSFLKYKSVMAWIFPL